MVAETHNKQRRDGDAENTRGDRDVNFAANPFGFDGNLSLFRPSMPVPPETEDAPDEAEDTETPAPSEPTAAPVAEEKTPAPSRTPDTVVPDTAEKTTPAPEPAQAAEPVRRQDVAPAERTEPARRKADAPVATETPRTTESVVAAAPAPTTEPEPARRDWQREPERPEATQAPRAPREPVAPPQSEVPQAPQRPEDPVATPQAQYRPPEPERYRAPEPERRTERAPEPPRPTDRFEETGASYRSPESERRTEVTGTAPGHVRRPEEDRKAPVTFQMVGNTTDLSKPYDLKPEVSTDARFRFESDEEPREPEATSTQSRGASDAMAEERPTSPRPPRRPTRRVGDTTTQDQALQERPPARPTKRVGAGPAAGDTSQGRPLRPTRRVGRAAEADARTDLAARERIMNTGVLSTDDMKPSPRILGGTDQFSLNDFGDASASALEAAFSAGRSAIESSSNEPEAARTGGFRRLRKMVRKRGTTGRDRMNQDLENLYPDHGNPFEEFEPFRKDFDFSGSEEVRLETERVPEEPSRPSAADARRNRLRDEESESRPKKSGFFSRFGSKSRDTQSSKANWPGKGDETDASQVSEEPKPAPSTPPIDGLEPVRSETLRRERSTGSMAPVSGDTPSASKPVRPATPKRDYPTGISKATAADQSPSRDYYTGVSTTVRSDVRNANDPVRQNPSSTMSMKIPLTPAPATAAPAPEAREDLTSQVQQSQVLSDSVRSVTDEPAAAVTSPTTQLTPEERERRTGRRDGEDGTNEALASLVEEPATGSYDAIKSDSSGKISFEERLNQSFQQREEEVAAKNARIRRVAAIVVFVAAVGALTMALVMFLRPETPPGLPASEPEPIELPPTTVVYRGEFRNAVYSSGITAPQSTTAVTSPVDGTIDTLLVSEGSDVVQGDVLFTVHNDAIEQAMKSAQTSVDTATKNVDSTTIELVNATDTYERTYNFFAALGDFTGFDEQGLIAKVNAADSAHVAAMDELARAKDALVAAQAEDDKRIVRAPMTGNVVSLTASMGMQVSSAELAPGVPPLLELADLSQMKVVASFREADVPNLHEGQLVELNFLSMAGSLMYGTVMNIAAEPTAADGAYGSEPTWAVDIAVTTPDHGLKPGMAADVTVLLQQVPDTLIVPSSALWDEMGSDGQLRHYVLVLTSSSTGATRKAEVAVSAVNDTEAAVWGELTEGDLVVTNPTFASELPESSESSESSE